MSFQTLCPTTGQVLYSKKPESQKSVKEKLTKAVEGWQIWHKESVSGRLRNFQTLSEILESDKEKLARLITLEMGKPITQSRAEIEKCAWICRYYSENAKGWLKDEPVSTEASNSYVSYEPLGLVLGIMPWNFPFWQVFRAAVPALVGGNAFLLKHATNVPQCAKALEELFKKAQFPPGVFQALWITHDQVDFVLSDQRVAAVTLTGSESAGRSVAALAGKHLKKSVLELGGSDPFLVLAEANLKRASEDALLSRFQNAGQSCIAAKRIIVRNTIIDRFLELLKEKMATLKMGNPMEESTTLGPLARKDLVENLERQIKQSVKKGAHIVVGGKRLNGEGCFFAPTLITNVAPGMPLWDEEVFGPVACVTIANSPDEALDLANQTNYGLGASVWTEDLEKAARFVRSLNAGTVFVNGMVKSDPRMPFGGIKNSGYGRELSVFGVREFQNIKSVWIH